MSKSTVILSFLIAALAGSTFAIGNIAYEQEYQINRTKIIISNLNQRISTDEMLNQTQQKIMAKRVDKLYRNEEKIGTIIVEIVEAIQSEPDTKPSKLPEWIHPENSETRTRYPEHSHVNDLSDLLSGAHGL